MLQLQSHLAFPIVRRETQASAGARHGFLRGGAGGCLHHTVGRVEWLGHQVHGVHCQAWLGVALLGLGRRGYCPVEGTRARLIAAEGSTALGLLGWAVSGLCLAPVGSWAQTSPS